MLKRAVRLYSTPFLNNLNNLCRKESYSTESSPVKLKYDLFSAVCLERHPVITRPMNDLEKRYSEYLAKLEVENSLKCDFELQKEMEMQEQKLIKQKIKEVDLDKPISLNTMDIEEMGKSALKEFPFAPRITEADEKNILTSLERKLDKNLLLLVNQKLGETTFLLPPQSIRTEDETMIETARRALKELCGDELNVKFYGNAPVGVYKFKYPRKVREKLNKDGAKIFYFLAKYIKGNIPSQIKYQWLDRGELKQVLPPRVYNNMSHFLIPE